MSSVSDDQKTKMVHKMKHDLEDWREALLLINSLLRCDKAYFSAIIGGVVSFSYLFIWWMDMSVLTTVSLALLSFFLLDYGYPIVSKFAFSPEQWTGDQEKEYEALCKKLCSWSKSFCLVRECIFLRREKKSSLFYALAALLMILCAYFGAICDNLLICYLLTMVLALYPGLKKNKIVKTVEEKLWVVAKMQVNFLKQFFPTDVKKTE